MARHCPGHAAGATRRSTGHARPYGRGNCRLFRCAGHQPRQAHPRCPPENDLPTGRGRERCRAGSIFIKERHGHRSCLLLFFVAAKPLSAGLPSVAIQSSTVEYIHSHPTFERKSARSWPSITKSSVIICRTCAPRGTQQRGTQTRLDSVPFASACPGLEDAGESRCRPDAFLKKCLRQWCSGFELGCPFDQANSAQPPSDLLPTNPPESYLWGELTSARTDA